MSRKKRTPSPTGIYHWIVRGIHKKHIFHRRPDFEYFKNLLLKYKTEHEVSIYHYCLMNNHAHLLVQAGEDLRPLVGFSTNILSKYAYYYCGAYKWTGSVFMRGYRSIPVTKDEYLLECGRYIERNPITAHLVQSPDQYPHSSYIFYKSSQPDDLVTPSPAFIKLDPIDEIRRRIYTNYVESIRIQDKELLR